VPSQYLLDIANLNIKGELPLDEIQQNFKVITKTNQPKPQRKNGKKKRTWFL
jgi:hypothetical protein